MAHPDDYDFYLECGCRDVGHSLGIHKMPDGYSLMLDADGMYFFWMELTGHGEFTPIKLRASTTRVDALKAPAEAAIRRVRARENETAEEWAERVGPTFFSDLEE